MYGGEDGASVQSSVVKKMTKVSVDDSNPTYSKNLNEKSLAAPGRGHEEFDDIVSDNAQYGRVQFWDERYLNDQGRHISIHHLPIHQSTHPCLNENRTVRVVL